MEVISAQVTGIYTYFRRVSFTEARLSHENQLIFRRAGILKHDTSSWLPLSEERRGEEQTENPVNGLLMILSRECWQHSNSASTQAIFPWIKRSCFSKCASFLHYHSPHSKKTQTEIQEEEKIAQQGGKQWDFSFKWKVLYRMHYWAQWWEKNDYYKYRVRVRGSPCNSFSMVIWHVSYIYSMLPQN